MRRLACCLFAVLWSSAAGAQDAAALQERSRQLAVRATAGLHALADAYAAQKRHGEALALRTEIWQEYAPADAKARDKTGFVAVGDTWRRDEAKVVLDADLKGGDAKALKKADAQWQAVQKELLAGHRALAVGWQALGDGAQAAGQWRRVLRFAPGDKEAAAALAVQPFDGFIGTPADLALFRRGRTIRLASDWLRRTAFATRALAEPQPLLAAAGVAHTGVASRHFRVFGTLPPEDLATIAQDAERALLLAATLVGTWGGAVFTPGRHRDLVYVRAGEYEAAIERCRDQFDAARLQFLKTAVTFAFVDTAAGPVRLHKSELGMAANRDMAVRGVVCDALDIRTEGMIEGVGHAACGFLFDRTLTFLVEQQKDRTAASWTQRALLPDIAVWAQMAEESAWAKSDTRTSELVLLQAARFTTDQRVKSWAVCNYFAHWRPDLIQALDRMPSKDVRTPPDVEATFLRATQVDLVRTDAEWREFWARGGALRKAMAVDPVPGEKEKGRAEALRARSLADAVNAARAAAGIGPAGWFVANGPDALGAKAYDEQLRKAEAERDKRRKAKARDAEAVALPPLPASFDATVLYARAETADAAVARWLADPARRELLLHPGRELFGCSTYAGAWILDVAQPARAPTDGLPSCWPSAGQSGWPAAVAVADLAPAIQAQLAAAGVPAGATVGAPLTLHFWRPLAAADVAAVGCRVFAGNAPVDGVFVAAAAGAGLPTGCCAFVPRAPLPSGATVEARWTLPKSVLGKDGVFAPVVFPAP